MAAWSWSTTDRRCAGSSDRCPVAVYQPQMAAYVHVLEAGAAERVARAVLIFLMPAGHVERTLDRDLLRLAEHYGDA